MVWVQRPEETLKAWMIALGEDLASLFQGYRSITPPNPAFDDSSGPPGRGTSVWALSWEACSKLKEA
ncbi:MAG: hypothetical protein Q9169_001482 [Polycauliona sp. 2 TL-2023]